jgi:hypothetical protein
MARRRYGTELYTAARSPRAGSGLQSKVVVCGHNQSMGFLKKKKKGQSMGPENRRKE